ncbi:MAG: anti-toxin [Gammaproteobacteria bacterium RIFCSPHIGHO2_12_38_15]|nr:MAG: anti-toxin [Gammaproteobacteria bacterium RIFCSPHIGHO2_12_38_15]
MLAIRLPEEIERRLEILAKKTHRSKSFYVREAILTHIEDLEDYYEALNILKHPGKIYSLDEIEKKYDLED